MLHQLDKSLVVTLAGGAELNLLLVSIHANRVGESGLKLTQHSAHKSIICRMELQVALQVDRGVRELRPFLLLTF